MLRFKKRKYPKTKYKIWDTVKYNKKYMEKWDYAIGKVTGIYIYGAWMVTYFTTFARAGDGLLETNLEKV